MTAPRIQLAGRTSGQARGLVQRLAGYALSRGTTEVTLAVRGVLLAVSLGPSAFGTWALLRLIMRYSALSAIGVYRGLELELIQQRERAGPSDRTANSAALGFVLLVSGSIAGLAVGGSFLVPGETRLLLRAFAFASLAEAVYGYALVCTRTAGDLRRYAMLEWGTSVLHLLCAVGLAWRWGLAGAFVGLILANLLGLALASRWVELTPSWAWPPVRRMLRVGFPVVLTMALGIMLATADRWAIALWGGTVMLGYYAFAGSVTTVAGTLAIVVRTVVFPSVYGQASTGGAAAALRTHLESALLPYARLLPPVLGLASLALAPLIAHTLPHYVEAIAPARIFLLAGVAMGLVNIASLGAVAAGRQHRLPFYATLSLAFALFLSVLSLVTGGGLSSVAASSFVGQLIFAALVLRLNVREIRIPRAELFVATLLLPLVWCAAAVALSSAVFPGLNPQSALQSVGLYLLLLSPLAAQWAGEVRRLREPGSN